MPKRKVYMIVTNDEYETPVLCDIVGKQTVADYIGVPISTFYKYLSTGDWKFCKYKAIDLGYIDEQEDFVPASINLTDEEIQNNKNSRMKRKHQQTRENQLKIKKELYYKNREENIRKSKEYYQNHREEKLKYASEYWQLKKKGLKGKTL